VRPADAPFRTVVMMAEDEVPQAAAFDPQRGEILVGGRKGANAFLRWISSQGANGEDIDATGLAPILSVARFAPEGFSLFDAKGDFYVLRDGGLLHVVVDWDDPTTAAIEEAPETLLSGCGIQDPRLRVAMAASGGVVWIGGCDTLLRLNPFSDPPNAERLSLRRAPDELYQADILGPPAIRSIAPTCADRATAASPGQGSTLADEKGWIFEVLSSETEPWDPLVIREHPLNEDGGHPWNLDQGEPLFTFDRDGVVSVVFSHQSFGTVYRLGSFERLLIPHAPLSTASAPGGEIIIALPYRRYFELR